MYFKYHITFLLLTCSSVLTLKECSLFLSFVIISTRMDVILGALDKEQLYDQMLCVMSLYISFVSSRSASHFLRCVSFFVSMNLTECASVV